MPSQSRGALYPILLSLTLVWWGCSDEPDPTVPVVESEGPDVAWLQANAFAFDSPEAETGFADLEPLRELVGDARIVALGEGTHGAREFFQMKHRLLEFLVKEMGFNTFAIEATWPESNLVNDYVLTGEGDPVRLLAGLYFWTWNTQEVLDQILWMRRHNENPGDAPRVKFFGFDMQFPQMAIDNVVSYLEAVDPDYAITASEKYDCYRRNWNGYGELSSLARTNCGLAVQAVYDSVHAHESEYLGFSSQEAFALALQNARIVVQNEDYKRGGGAAVRDRYMAENTSWLLEQEGPGAKIVLWAHNGHVGELQNGAWRSMGTHLREKYGNDMVVMGFAFNQGSFNAYEMFPDGSYGQLKAHSVGPTTRVSYERFFSQAGFARFILDLRPVLTETSPTGVWMNGPQDFRSIGAVYGPVRDNYFSPTYLPMVYDAVVFFESTVASRLLPFHSSQSPPAHNRLIRAAPSLQ